ncbi:hypothetical protein LRS06_04720 [Hymenobacter sp. J193]|uniref:hypothetical protein n=1 Tax=Hymenobacter sp. J193 TaxID=2898429 RepID=UPI002151F402|nr:hypothetical protein [Hymenobacter sp. J193]MCR5887090.1 hypothetical protein [Hymenobacter sp. J193]
MAGWAHAQGSGPGVAGARAAGMGQAAATLSDVWALSNNVAGLGSLNRLEIGVAAENRFLTRALSTATLAAAAPLGRATADNAAGRYGVVGITFQRFGDKLYNEQRVAAGYAYRTGVMSVGARVDMLQVSLEGLGSQRAVAASVGAQAELLPRRLVFGAFLYNLNQARLASYEDERVPTVLRAGLSYRPTEKVMLNAEVEKDLDRGAEFRGGLEYQALPALALRAGVLGLSEQVTGGAGLRAGRFRFDYAAAWHSSLGLSQFLTAAFRLDSPEAATVPAQP